MNLLLSAMLFGAAFIGMELLSWAVHKYLMHGPLWAIHRTHHEPHAGRFELNDLFSLLFGSIAAVLIYLGARHGDYRLPIGMGITAYGLTYFLLHDILIHNRLGKAMYIKMPWLRRLARAHKIHHKTLTRTRSRAFGLLWVRSEVFE